MSLIRVDNFGPSAGGTTYSAGGIAKAWVNFNGQGTLSVRDSLNTSSVADNGVGNNTQSFTSSFANTGYSMTSSNLAEYNHPRGVWGTALAVDGLGVEVGKAAGSVLLYTSYNASSTANGGAADYSTLCVHLFGDLA